MWRLLPLKRKPQKTVNKDSGLAKILGDKIDEYISYLDSNEEDIAKIVSELSTRNLSDSQKDTIKNSYSEYEKVAKNLTSYLEKY